MASVVASFSVCLAIIFMSFNTQANSTFSDNCDMANSDDNLTEIDLHEQLFNENKYNKNIMPRKNKTEPMVVNIEMMALSIENIDEKKQTISFRAFLEVTWTDEFLWWSPEKYKDVEFISKKVEDIWLPDISLKDTFARVTDIGQEGGHANIKNNGTVTIWPYGTYKVACRISIASFPFDKQSCRFVFSSWTKPFSAFKITNKHGKLNLTRYEPSGEWELEKNKVSFDKQTYKNETWHYIVFEIFIKRKPTYYVMNIMTPVLCISLLNVFCFLLPSQDGERVTLSISIFLTLAVFLTIVNETMPESSDEASKFGIYVGLQLFGNALTIAVTTISLWVFHRHEKRRVPKVFKILVRVMCMSKPEERNALFRLAKNITGTLRKTTNGVNETINDDTIPEKNDSNLNCMTHAIGTMSSMETMCDKTNNSNQTSGITWRMVSMAIDRFCIIASIAWHSVLLVILIGSIASG